MRNVWFRPIEAGLWVLFAVTAVYTFTQTMAASGYSVDASRLMNAILPGDLSYDLPEPLLLVVVVLAIPIFFSRADSYFSFWIGALIGVVLFLPAIIASSDLYWPELFGIDRVFQPSASDSTLLILTVLSVETLYAISRLISLRARQETLVKTGVLAEERTQVAASELTMIAVTVMASTVLAGVVTGIGMLLSNADGLFVQLPWTVVSTGLFGIAAVSVFLIVWVRTLVRDD